MAKAAALVGGVSGRQRGVAHQAQGGDGLGARQEAQRRRRREEEACHHVQPVSDMSGKSRFGKVAASERLSALSFTS